MGVAGSGKSKQGRLLADERGLPWLSTGEFLRMLISGERRKAMVAGELLGDQEIIALVQKIFHLIDSENEFVLDGFPRTLTQAEWLLSQVRHGQLKVTAVIHLKASQEAVKQRLLGRGRPDDHEEAISARFQEYEEAIKPILEQFRTYGTPVFDINGEQSVAEVERQVESALNGLIS